MEIRRADFAGSWYPSRATECERQIKAFLREGEGKRSEGGEPVGGIVPHAGWMYSGAIACNVIRCLSEGAVPDVLLVFGMHLSEHATSFIMTEGAWETPFGEIVIEKVLAERLIERFAFRKETPRHHTQDNTIELQLPFIKYFFPDAGLLPVGVPPTEEALAIGCAAVEAAAELGMRIKVIGSTDLTHYGANYGFAPRGSGTSAVSWVKETNDRRIIDAMLAMTPEKVIHEALANQNACCSGAAATAIAAAKRLGAVQARLLTYATSYDRSPGHSFVGYAGILFEK